MWGGGGGGGGGSGGGNTTHAYACGGAGGGAPLAMRVNVSVTPNTTYDLVAGAAGLAGAGGTAGGSAGGDGVAGTDGGDTTFGIHSGSVLQRARGAKGGRGGQCLVNNVDASSTHLVTGGTPVAMARPTLAGLAVPIPYNTLGTYVSGVFGPGFGGDGITAIGLLPGSVVDSVRNGADSIEGHVGGAGGIPGNWSGSYAGGGPGGGGAAGPGSGGVDAGGAGNGNSSGAGGTADPVIVGFAGGSGCGGSGGGGGGSGTSGGAGTAGTNGDTGFIGLRVIG